MTKPEMPDCRSCVHYANANGIDWCRNHEPCTNGAEFVDIKFQPIRLYEIEVKE